MASLVLLKAWYDLVLSEHGPPRSPTRTVLCGFFRYFGSDGWAWPSQRTLTKVTALSLPAVNQHIHYALKEGWLRRIRLSNRSYAYQVQIPRNLLQFVSPELQKAFERLPVDPPSNRLPKGVKPLLTERLSGNTGSLKLVSSTVKSDETQSTKEIERNYLENYSNNFQTSQYKENSNQVLPSDLLKPEDCGPGTEFHQIATHMEWTDERVEWPLLRSFINAKIREFGKEITMKAVLSLRLEPPERLRAEFPAVLQEHIERQLNRNSSPQKKRALGPT